MSGHGQPMLFDIPRLVRGAQEQAPPPRDENDHERVATLLRGLIGKAAVPDLWVSFIHPGAPVSKSRARWHRKQQRFYTPANTVEAERALAREFAPHVVEH